MKTKLTLCAALMVFMLSMPSFTNAKEVNSVSVSQKRTIIEFGDFEYNGSWYYVFGDPSTGEVTSIFLLNGGPDVLTFSGTATYDSVHHYWVGDVSGTFVGGGTFSFHGQLLFA
ncbi:hypothetical protein [Pedobacter metabolipauper]|uniref:Uncharacterized protein n=1 Tax=Pedobacter metabolipauper TaxID=425513 RepID=A0A4R6SSX8_9SPHI|nr:hypothetical protein [Pedobacter metabolipauper]TDQ07711.1 hypothetical protein ATK78_3840 [Pedobacter metabolipauper]